MAAILFIHHCINPKINSQSIKMSIIIYNKSENFCSLILGKSSYYKMSEPIKLPEIFRSIFPNFDSHNVAIPVH